MAFVKSATFGLSVAAVALAAGVAALTPWQAVEAERPAASAEPQATPAAVARVERRDIRIWSEFSGRLEAVGRVEVRPRVAGQIRSIHFREGALVQKGDPLVTIDPEPFAAEVERARAEVAAVEARTALARNDLERGRRMTAVSTISERDLDARASTVRQSEAALDAAKAALRTAELNLGYTDVRAPIAGRVGRIEITEGNLVSSGPGAPVLVRLVSVDPIYASFDADEATVAKALSDLPAGRDRADAAGDVPVEIAGVAEGRLQYVDPSVDAATGSVRVRAVFTNPGGRLMPGQFARIRLGAAKTAPEVLVSERAVGNDQDKQYVLVVGADDKAAYREVTLGPTADGLRVVRSGLSGGERVVVNGVQKLKPGALVRPEPVAMTGEPLQRQAAAD